MIKKVVSIIAVLLVVLFFLMLVFNSQFVKTSINTAGPKILGVPVSVEKVRTFLLLGRINITNLIIGNPDGFKTDNLFKMGELQIRFKPLSLLSDTIVITEILVIAPEVTYEMTLSGSNVGVLQKSLEGDEQPEAKEEPKEEKTESGKKVVIEKFLLSDGKLKLSVPGMMGTALPIPLPTIEMKDIGKEDESGGASATEVIGKIMNTVLSSVVKVVTGSGKLIGDGAKALGHGAAAVGGAAVDGVGAVGGAAVDAGKAVGKGVAGAVGGVVNLFGGSKDKDANGEASAGGEKTE